MPLLSQSVLNCYFFLYYCTLTMNKQMKNAQTGAVAPVCSLTYPGTKTRLTIGIAGTRRYWRYLYGIFVMLLPHVVPTLAKEE